MSEEILPFRAPNNVIETSRQATGEAIASLMPETLEALRELLRDEDPNVRFKAIKLLLDKQMPNPTAARTPVVTEADGEIVPEDVRELREKLFLEMQKERGRE